MVKKKICKWLDENIWGGIQIINNTIYPCCGPSESLVKLQNFEYASIDLKELQQKRIQLYNDILTMKD